jgi:hypothetical protein
MSNVVTALIAYWLTSNYNGEHYILFFVVSYLSLASTMMGAFMTKHVSSRIKYNLTALYGTFWTIVLALNIVFSYAGFRPSTYVVVIGLSLCACFISSYTVSNMKDSNK